MAPGSPAPALRRVRGPGLTLPLLAGCGLIVAYAACSSLHVGGDAVSSAVTYGGEVACMVATVIAAALRARRSAGGAARLGWVLVAVAFLGFLLGDGTT